MGRSLFVVPLGMLLTGTAMLGIAVIIGDFDWRFMFNVAGGMLLFFGYYFTSRAVTRKYGSAYVPTWLGILILLAIVAILPLVALFSWINAK